jgi:redox-sensitive bicupin YhaK (pirin superfamily)
MVVFAHSDSLAVSATGEARVLLIGGEPLGERQMFWNFVSDSAERIEQAKDDWRAGNFDKVPDDDEFIPLPGEG